MLEQDWLGSYSLFQRANRLMAFDRINEDRRALPKTDDCREVFDSDTSRRLI